MIHTIMSQPEFHKLTKTGRSVIDFYADWCGPCKAFAPTFDRYASTLSTKVSFYKVNVDNNEDICTKYGIRAMPTFLFMENGAVVGTVTGANEMAFRSKLSDLKWI